MFRVSVVVVGVSPQNTHGLMRLTCLSLCLCAEERETDFYSVCHVSVCLPELSSFLIPYRSRTTVIIIIIMQNSSVMSHFSDQSSSITVRFISSFNFKHTHTRMCLCLMCVTLLRVLVRLQVTAVLPQVL